ncbi:MAG: glycosyltransferase [Alteraurantiacibacter sp.]
MPRVLSISTLYPNAHLPRFGTFVARQMEALAARDDWDVTVINPIGVPPVVFGRYKALAAAAFSGEEGGVHVHRPRFTLLPTLGGPFNPAMIVRAVLPMARWLHDAKPFDLVDAQFFYPDGPAAARVAGDLGLPLCIKARGADIQHWGLKPYALQKMRMAAEQAAGLLAVSAAMRQDMAELGLPEEKVTVHYTGLDRRMFLVCDREVQRRDLAAQFGIHLSPHERLIACVGALIPRKGQELVIAALAQLPDVRLALVGAGPDEGKLRLLAREVGHDVEARVHFLGSLDHEALAQIIGAADVMALPSSSEGLANAWVEALACGTPLVITDAGGASELVHTPEAGRIVPRSVNAIAAGVRDVLQADYPSADVARTVERFSWEANADALASYYNQLIA